MQIQNKTFDKSQAFTLIELLVVISIIGLLSTLAITSLNSAKMKARDAKRMADIKMISDAVEIYNIDNGSYPNYAASCTNGAIALAGPSYKICSGTRFYKGSVTYINVLPSSPTPTAPDWYAFYFYYYGLNFYQIPCIEALLEAGDGNISFWCQGGDCKTYDWSISDWNQPYCQ